MVQFINAIPGLLKRRSDDNTIDRFNHFFTPTVLCILALLVGSKEYVGQPIICNVPSSLAYATQFVEAYCFWSNSSSGATRNCRPIAEIVRIVESTYNQWVPFLLILSLQALIFFLPILLCSTVNWHGGLRTEAITTMAANVASLEPINRAASVEVIASHIRTSLDQQRESKPTSPFWRVSKIGNQKRFFACFSSPTGRSTDSNVINVLFSRGSAFQGLHNVATRKLRTPGSSYFQRVTMCDVNLSHTVECDEGESFLCLLFVIHNDHRELASPRLRRAYIERYLRVITRSYDTPVDPRLIQRFVSNHLRPDSVLLIRLIECNNDDLLTTELLTSLWTEFYERNRLPPSSSNTGADSVSAMDHHSAS